MATISEKKAIIELYVGWFNRVPDVTGINHWITAFDDQSTLQEISNEFYNAAIHQFSASTGYSAGMSDNAFITQLYDGVMGRSVASGLAPPDATELAYWTNALTALNGDKGALLVQMIIEIKAFDATGNAPILEVQAKFANKVEVAEILAVSGSPLWSGNTVAEGKAALVGVKGDDATVAIAVNNALNISNSNIQSATTGIDILDGTDFDDTFSATQDTLGLGDEFNGKAGDDSLDISISGAGVTLAGFKTTSVENINVKSIASGASTLDMSDVSGAKVIKSYETDGAALTFRDIQASSAQISLVDTDEDHTINYDIQALAGASDTVTLNVQEIRPTNSTAVVDIDFTQDNSNTDAAIENLVVNSNTIANNIKSIRVGDALDTMDINGSADLNVNDALDQNLNTVNAFDLNAKLDLDMSNANQSDNDSDGIPDLEISFTGAKSDTRITFGDAENIKTITTQEGNDTITANGGVNTVTAAAGDDVITLGNGNDSVNAGAGDDTLNDAGGNNTVDMGAGNDTATFSGVGDDVIKGGAGNDTITAAAGQDNIDAGSGDDLMIMTPGDLEVSDTITGGDGIDTVRITDGDTIGQSETQRVSEVEIFDLDGSGTTLAVTDNLIETAKDKDFTVDTSNAEGSHSIDMTAITTPNYKFTLIGSESQAEVVIADDATINSMSTLQFDSGNVTATTSTTTSTSTTSTTSTTTSTMTTSSSANTQDTLRVVDGATITSSDLINVTGLDIIYLEASSNTAQAWDIDLDRDMIVTVAPTIPAGSVLNIKALGSAVVVVNFNANITVNIDPAGTGTVTTNTEFLFTDNADNMTGTTGDDIFIADSRDQVETADFANGNTEATVGDELKLNFGVFNSGESLDEQLNKADISEMEIITFKQDLNASSGVRFNDVDGTTGSMEVDLNIINLTDRNDTVTVNDANGVTVNGFGDADVLTTHAAATLNGGDGNDTINGSSASDILNGDADDDTIIGNGGNDTVDGGSGNDAITTNSGDDNVTGGTGDDSVDVAAGNDTVSLGDGTDSVTLAANDLSSNDSIDGGAGIDTLITSDVNLADGDFTHVTTMDVLTFNAPTLGNFGSEFKESGIRTINGSSGSESINFQNVSNDAHLIIEGNDGNDGIMGGSGNDTITGGEGSDLIIGSTGADTIDLGESVSAVDLVVYNRAEDGAQTGQNTGYDVIQRFVAGTDRIVIDGALEAALDTDSLSGDFTLDTFTNKSDLDVGVDTGLAVYTDTPLQDSHLTQANFTNLLSFLNTNLKFAAAGDNVLYVVQSTNNTGVYFYQENTGDNEIDLNELKMLTLVDSGLTSSSVSARSASVVEQSKGDSLLTGASISNEDVAEIGVITTPPVVSEPEFSLTVSTSDVAEGDTGTNPVVTATVTRTDTSEAVTIDIATSDGTASAGSDYNAVPTTQLSFDAGVATATLDITIIGDTEIETDENFTVAISNPSSGTVDDNASSAIVTISNDDVAAVTSASIAVTTGNSSPEDASSLDIAFSFAQGNYEYSINGFGLGDTLDVLDDGAITVKNTLVDGNIDIDIADSATGSVVQIHLVGLDQNLDGQVFNEASFINTFGTGSLA